MPRVLTPVSPEPEILAVFNSTPWCRRMIEDPTFFAVETPSRAPRIDLDGKAYDSFFGTTLATPSTVRACISLYRKSSSPLSGTIGNDAGSGEVRTLMAVGSGVNGHIDTCHGGFVSSVLDEAMGMAVTYYHAKSTFTAYLNVTFKKPVPTPSILLCRAWVTKTERRKVFVSGTVENGEGVVYSSAEGLFVNVAESNL